MKEALFMLKRHIRTACFLPLLLAVGCVPAYSSNTYDRISNTVAHGAPKGSYNSWSEAQQEDNINDITQACSISCTMEFESSHIPLEIAMGQTYTCTYACLYNNLPFDYPAKASYKAKAVEYYRIAVKLGSKLPPPTLN